MSAEDRSCTIVMSAKSVTGANTAVIAKQIVFLVIFIHSLLGLSRRMVRSRAHAELHPHKVELLGYRDAKSCALKDGFAAAADHTFNPERLRPEDGGKVKRVVGGFVQLAEGWQGRVTLPSRKYTLSLSSDGKRLVLTRTNGFMLTIR